MPQGLRRLLHVRSHEAAQTISPAGNLHRNFTHIGRSRERGQRSWEEATSDSVVQMTAPEQRLLEYLAADLSRAEIAQREQRDERTSHEGAIRRLANGRNRKHSLAYQHHNAS
ncbi:MAG: hypothetical protein ACR2PL_19755, partial [Dehalococcoidia bacterium]